MSAAILPMPDFVDLDNAGVPESFFLQHRVGGSNMTLSQPPGMGLESAYWI